MLTATAVQNYEQTYTMYARIHLYCLIAAVAFLVLAIVLFFVLRIPQVFGELTGRTARKAVQEMKEGNPHSGELASKKKQAEHKKQNKTKGKKTQQDPREEEERKRVYHDMVGKNDTPVSLVSLDDVVTPTVMHPTDAETAEMETAVLQPEEIHIPLQPEEETETSVLMHDNAETLPCCSEVFTPPIQMPDETETSVLTPMQMPQKVSRLSEDDFVVLRSVVEIHTEEVI